MPYGDGTGPDGRGSRTGRGMGNCPQRAGYQRGFGRRRFGCPIVPITGDEEAEMLKKQKAAIESRLKELE